MKDNFKNPGKEYRPIPFWSWNDTLEIEEIQRQIDEMAKGGVGGYFMHARSGLTNEYLGKEWHDCIRAGIDGAKKNQLDAWIYDEEGWPSGFAGGIVTKMSVDYQAKYLMFEEYENRKEIDLKDILAAYQVKANESYVRISKDCLDEKNLSALSEDKILIIRRKVQQYYIDVMNKDAVDTFLLVTHEEYYRRYRESFGKELKGFFTDEPRFIGMRPGQMPWSDQLPMEVMKRYGYDLLNYLPCLWKDTSESDKIRYEFWTMVNDLFVHNYMENIYQWCEEHSCKLTGHIMMEESIFSQMSTGGVMPCYEYEHIPGIDWLRRRIETPVIGKQVGSVASQLGKKQVLTESYGLAGWNLSFEEMKWILEWQYVNGVNLLCQHLQAYSIKGSRKRDYPPSFFTQQSWWEKFSHFSDYVGRLGVALSEGKQRAEVLVLHPMRSGYLSYDSTRTMEMQQLDEHFIALSETLSGSHINYHYGDETILSKHGEVNQTVFTVGENQYEIVILPRMYAIDIKTLTLLLEFGRNGGVLLCTDELPYYCNGDKTLLFELRNYVKFIDFEELLPYLVKVDKVLISITEMGEQVNDIHLSYRETKEGTLLFLVNHSQEETYHSNISVFHKRAKASLWLAESGEEIEIDSSYDGNTNFNLTFLPMQSYLVMLNDTKEEQSLLSVKEKQYVSIDNKWGIKETGRNSLTLDLCHYRINDGELHGPIATINLMKLLLDRKQDVTIELSYDFTIATDPKKLKELLLVLEDSDKYCIYVNSKKVNQEITGYWKDRSFHTIDIHSHVLKGKNTIVLKGVFHQDQKVYDVLYGENVYETERNKLTFNMEMESIYLIGDFGVYSCSDETKTNRQAFFTDGPFEITEKPTKFIHNNFTTQGFLFFSESIVITQTININKQKGKDIILRYGKPNAPVIDITVNGTLIKNAMWAPYEVDITKAAVEGENLIEIRLYASNRNLLGPHHHIKGECYSVGPSSFTGEWSWVEKRSEADATNEADRGNNYWTDSYCFVEFGFCF